MNGVGVCMKETPGSPSLIHQEKDIRLRTGQGPSADTSSALTLTLRFRPAGARGRNVCCLGTWSVAFCYSSQEARGTYLAKPT